MTSAIINKALVLTKFPFTKGWTYYTSLIALLVLYIAGYWSSGQSGIFVFTCSLFFIYLYCVVLCLIPKFFRITVHTITYTYLILLSLLTFFGGLFIRTPDSLNTLSLILQTNTSEASDFFKSYVDIRAILISCGIVTFCIALFILLKLKIIKQVVSKIAGILTICSICCASSFYIPKIAYSTPFLCLFDKPWDNFVIRNLNDYRTNPNLVEIESSHPDVVVIIVGESFSKSHSSLYGYTKNTNPCLKDLNNNSNLYVFENIHSSTTGTGSAFKHIMSTYSERNDSEEWYKCQTVPNIMKSIGYKTYWLSNQVCGGLYDAIPNHYAELCDTTSFSKGNEFDEILISQLKNALDGFNEKKFFILHLAGSHESFDTKFPDTYRLFDASNYNTYPEWQRQMRADYDNSIRYNDYVVSNLIKCIKDENAIVFYFPDHGLDIYDSEPHFVGHATSAIESQRAAKQIPFMIYVTEKYENSYPLATTKISKSIHKDFCTQDFIYSLIDILGYRFKDCDDVSKYTLFD